MLRFLPLALLIVAAPAVAQQDGAPSNAKPAAEKKICRNAQPTGSRLSKRACHTKSDWAMIDAANAADAGRFQARQRDRDRN